jgi:hypothetical protein
MYLNRRKSSFHELAVGYPSCSTKLKYKGLRS